ncbi:MAG: DUF349 domain-containing protein [Bacteroidaceae bacterium]|nr:DUF349 domain-containing protein [Bacteroidaceae bacterium]
MEENNVQSTLDEQVVEATAPTVEETPEKTADNAVEVNEEEPVSEETTEVSVPDTKEGIISRLKEIAESDGDISRQEIDSLKSHFYRIIKAESEEAFKAFTEGGGDPETFEPTIDPLEQVFKEQMNVVREKRAAQHEAQEKLKEENYLKKMQIIEKIKQILENPDEVNRSYNDFRQLQQDWNEIKEVPAEKATELWKNYQANVEKFYDTLKLNNEFRAYDFKKNLEMKTALCDKAEALAEESDIVVAFRKLQQYHQQFREIGPVAKELREDIWNRFKNASTVINKRHQEFFEGRKEQEQNNLEQKTAICETIEAIDIESLKSFAQWNETSEKITQLQAQWKTIGFAPQKMNQKIYDRFRAACDLFFQKKAEFFKSVRENLSENLRRKKELCEKAEALKDSTDWKATTDQLIALQKEWKTIGAVAKKQSDEVWARFNAACDAFFENKKANTSSQFAEQNENLQKKRSIIERLAAIVPEEAGDDLRQQLRDAQAEWDGIGHVPFKEKDKTFKALREQMDRLYGFLGENASRRRVERFKNEVANGNGGNIRERLSRQAEILQQEIKTYENNLGFLNLSKSKSGNSLVDELNRKVDKLRADLKEIKEKISVIDSQE